MAIFHLPTKECCSRLLPVAVGLAVSTATIALAVMSFSNPHSETNTKQGGAALFLGIVFLSISCLAGKVACHVRSTPPTPLAVVVIEPANLGIR